MSRPDLAEVYTGATAATYDQQRTVTDIWQREQQVIGPVLRAGMPPGTRVLDLAAGTGRWLDLYAAGGMRPTLLDVSADMLQVAAARAAALGVPIEILQGDLFTMPSLPEADWLVCTRFFNWIPLRRVSAVLGLAHRHGIGTLAFTVRCTDPTAAAHARFASWWGWQRKNLQVLSGARKKGFYHLHSAARLRRAIVRTGWRAAAEHVIERTSGDTYALYVLTRTR